MASGASMSPTTVTAALSSEPSALPANHRDAGAFQTGLHLLQVAGQGKERA